MKYYDHPSEYGPNEQYPANSHSQGPVHYKNNEQYPNKDSQGRLLKKCMKCKVVMYYDVYCQCMVATGRDIRRKINERYTKPKRRKNRPLVRSNNVDSDTNVNLRLFK